MTYYFFAQNKQPVCGMLKPPRKEAPNTWMSNITAEDINATVEKATSLEATVIPDKGSFSCLTDPNGAGIGFWEFE